MSTLLDPELELRDSLADLDDAEYEEATTEYILVQLGACPVPESIQIQDLTGPTPILRAGRNTYIASIEQLVGTGILLSTAPSFEPVARVESVLVLAALPPLPLGKLAKDKAKKAAATRKRIAAVPRAQKPKAQKLPIEKVGTASKKKTLITSDQEDEDEDSEEQGEGQSGGEASGTGLSRDEVMSDA